MKFNNRWTQWLVHASAADFSLPRLAVGRTEKSMYKKLKLSILFSSMNCGSWAWDQHKASLTALFVEFDSHCSHSSWLEKTDTRQEEPN